MKSSELAMFTYVMSLSSPSDEELAELTSIGSAIQTEIDKQEHLDLEMFLIYNKEDFLEGLEKLNELKKYIY